MTALVATVDSAIRIARADLTDAALAELRRAVAIDNPAHVDALRRGRVPRGIDREIVDLQVGDDEILVPRGCTAIVRELGFRLEDRRAVRPHRFTFAGELRAAQRDARDAALRAEQGQIIAPCGFGKSRTGLAIVAAAGQVALVLVPTVDIAHQWAADARALLGVEPSICADGAWRVAPVTIATAQAYVAHLDDAGAFGTLIVDEAHHAAAPTWASAIDATPAKYRVGLTATPRADGLGPLVDHRLGRVVYQATIAATVAAGHLEQPDFRVVRTGFCFDYQCAEDWPALLEALVDDADRNAQIADLVAAECRGGEVGLVVTGRVAHAELLVEMLVERGLRAKVLVGALSKKARAAVIAEARAGEIDVVVGTQVADEGLDVPRLSRAFLAFPARSEGRIVQRVGRILRRHPGKAPPIVFDVVDELVGVLAYQARRRARLFASTWGTEGSRAA